MSLGSGTSGETSPSSQPGRWSTERAHSTAPGEEGHETEEEEAEEVPDSSPSLSGSSDESD